MKRLRTSENLEIPTMASLELGCFCTARLADVAPGSNDSISNASWYYGATIRVTPAAARVSFLHIFTSPSQTLHVAA